MTPEQAQAIYFAGQDAAVASLCELDAQVQASQQEIEALQRKIAQLSKNSSNSSKRPSSDDITKPQKGTKKNHGADEKGNKIGGQPGHPKHTRAPYPPEAISHTHEHESMDCPLCGARDILWIEDLPPDREFDTLLLLMNGAALAGTLPRLSDLLRLLDGQLAPGGQMLLDSTDILGGDPPAAGSWDEDGYPGEVQYQLEFRGERGAPFPQLFIDPVTLERVAAKDTDLDRVG